MAISVNFDIDTLEQEFNKARSNFENQKYDEAEEGFLNILSRQGDHFEANNYLGVIYGIQEDLNNSLKYLEKAINLNPKHPDPYSNIGIMLFRHGDIETAYKYHRYSIKLDPDNYKSYYNIGVAERELGLINNAISSFSRSIELNNSFAPAHFNLALLNLLLGNYKDGWEGYEWGFKTTERVERNINKQRWRGEPLKGRTIFVYADQGYGDTIQFLRYLPLLKTSGARVIFECQPPLYNLLNGMSIFDELVSPGIVTSENLEFDYQSPLLSLPLFFQNEKSQIPGGIYDFNLDIKVLDYWKSQMQSGDRLKIGIAWTGNTKHPHNIVRACGPNYFIDSFKDLNCDLYSLQYNVADPKILAKLKSAQIRNITQNSSDFRDTAAIIKQLDLIITVDTSIAHLSGALGKEVWVLLAYVPDWRWLLDLDYSPWYSSVKLFRQPNRNGWDELFAEVKKRLIHKIENESR